MNGKAQRISPRVSYHATARIVRGHGGAPAEGAEVVNLGLGGLCFESSTLFERQEAVDCELAIGGLRTQLPGKIAWSAVSKEDARQRCGVAFDPLPEHEQSLVYQAVVATRAGGQPITLRFTDMNRKMEALALADTGGLRIRTPFPMLTAGTRVMVEESKANATAAGVVTAVDLDRSGPIPVLEFRVMLEAWPEPRTGVPAVTSEPAAEPHATVVTARVVSLQADDRSAADTDGVATPRDPKAAIAEQRPGAESAQMAKPHMAKPLETAAPHEPPRPMVAPAPSEAPVSEAPVSEAPVSEAPVSEAPVSEAPVSEASAPTAEPAPADRSASQPTPRLEEPSAAPPAAEAAHHVEQAAPPPLPTEGEVSPEAPPVLRGASTAPKPPRQLAGHGLRTRGLAFAALLTFALIAVAIAFGPLRRWLGAPQASETNASSAAALDGDQDGPFGTGDGERGTSTAADSADDATVEPASESPPLREPQVVAKNGHTTVRVPAQGSTDGMVVQLWKQPAGIALQLPSATVSLPARRYGFKRDEVVSVRVGEPNQRTALQVTVQRPILRHDVTLHGGVLEVQLDF